MYQANCKILSVKKDRECIIKDFPLDVQNVIRKNNWSSREKTDAIYKIPFGHYTKLAIDQEHNLLENAQDILNLDSIGLRNQKAQVLQYLAY